MKAFNVHLIYADGSYCCEFMYADNHDHAARKAKALWPEARTVYAEAA